MLGRHPSDGFQKPARRAGFQLPAVVDQRLSTLVAGLSRIAANHLVAMIFNAGFRSLKTDRAQVKDTLAVHGLLSLRTTPSDNWAGKMKLRLFSSTAAV